MSFVVENAKTETILSSDTQLNSTILYTDTYANSENNTILNIYTGTKYYNTVYLYTFDDDTNTLASKGHYTTDKYSYFNFLFQGDKLFIDNFDSYLPITNTEIGTPITTTNASILSDVIRINTPTQTYEDYIYAVHNGYVGSNKETYYKVGFNNDSFNIESSVTIDVDDSYSYYTDVAEDVLMRLEYSSTSNYLGNIRYYDFKNSLYSEKWLGSSYPMSSNSAMCAVNKDELAYATASDYGFNVYVINKNAGLFKIDTDASVQYTSSKPEMQRLSNKLFALYGSKGICIYAKNNDYSWSLVYEFYGNFTNFAYLNGKIIYTITPNISQQTYLSKNKIITGYQPSTTFIEGVNMDKLTTSKEGRIYTL